jgi:serine-threonine kinase receptor-associated protein
VRVFLSLLLNGRRSKIWDTFTGDVLHSFPHDHIVRSVALAPGATRLLTGGQENQVRVFDLSKPDAAPQLLLAGGATSHDKLVRSVVWVDPNTGVSAGEDGHVKYVACRAAAVVQL